MCELYYRSTCVSVDVPYHVMLLNNQYLVLGRAVVMK